MSQANLDSLYRQIDDLPSLPAIVTQVLQVTADPESSANDLMRVILPDPPMCTAILKIANSAFFGMPRQVSSIEKAVMVLGFDEIRTIVLGRAVFNSFRQLNGNNKKAIEAFWEHSFTCGLAAKVVAERSGQPHGEMFLAGLIHDIGKLAMLISFPLLYTPLLTTQSILTSNLLAQEKELFCISHDIVARKLLDKWLFPSSLLTAVGSHHHLDLSEEHYQLAVTVRIADILAHLSLEPQLKSDAMSTLLAIQPEILSLRQEQHLPCDEDEIQTWLQLLAESRIQDGAILQTFSS